MDKKSLASEAEESQDGQVNESKYIPEDEASEIYRVTHALSELFNTINHADGYDELLNARRLGEPVLADTIKNLNSAIEIMKENIPEIRIEEYAGPVEVPYLAIN